VYGTLCNSTCLLLAITVTGKHNGFVISNPAFVLMKLSDLGQVSLIS